MIIGLSGYARSGKDESARALVEVGYEQRAFADKLREFLYNLNPICFVDGATLVFVQDVIDKYGWGGYKETIYGDTIRVYLQRLGTDCGRNLLGDSVWVDATLGDATSANLVVSDCRFPNEADAIRERGGKVVRIVRPGVGPANDHPSETSLDDYDFDFVISNTGGIKDLHDKMRFIAYISS